MACTPTPTETLYEVLTTTSASTSFTDITSTIPPDISTSFSTFCASSSVDANDTSAAVCVSTDSVEVVTTVRGEYCLDDRSMRARHESLQSTRSPPCRRGLVFLRRVQWARTLRKRARQDRSLPAAERGFSVTIRCDCEVLSWEPSRKHIQTISLLISAFGSGARPVMIQRMNCSRAHCFGRQRAWLVLRGPESPRMSALLAPTLIV
ncbi:hypothetical protein L226DRAFT_307644 [Lentinus tigrinus ALCF2SS1-7]|uniref:Uncharacterized protein n=1 Tax=Lentinus tigrinus ALCF2SS1-6 TaxID=1328759 RepID=A0A5C2S367_9APHY|nr:hypothetical protein L227DRAFT_200732 [Lentinus tigrinus ALCF2SS1-6]RPD68978.1 hypothetical protein L226DRAFT_307644 [Lentinus tigrinus ALCF2SS1-7]